MHLDLVQSDIFKDLGVIVFFLEVLLLMLFAALSTFLIYVLPLSCQILLLSLFHGHMFFHVIKPNTPNPLITTNKLVALLY